MKSAYVRCASWLIERRRKTACRVRDESHAGQSESAGGYKREFESPNGLPPPAAGCEQPRRRGACGAVRRAAPRASVAPLACQRPRPAR
eukprot:2105161-Prymnesium_polylepis.1